MYNKYDYVKIRDERERFWCCVLEQKGEVLKVVVYNYLIMDHDYQLGDVVEFNVDKVIGYNEADSIAKHAKRELDMSVLLQNKDEVRAACEQELLEEETNNITITEVNDKQEV
jgi:hypothetical protein